MIRRRFSFALFAVLLGCSEAGLTPSDASSGGQVFADKCAICHAIPLMAYQVPQMRGRPPGFVYDALTDGAMRRIGRELDEPSRRAVAEFFTGVAFDSPASRRDFRVSPACSPEHQRFDWSDRAHPNWGGSLSNHHSVPDGEGVARGELDKLAVQWVVAFPESSQLRSHPTAAGGALFVGSHNGSVYALDQVTGCTRWHFKAVAEVRTAITIQFDGHDSELSTQTDVGTSGVHAYFADRAANVYALDAESGELLWKQTVDPHPSAAATGSISAHGGRIFVPISSNEDVGPIDPTYPCCTHAGAVVALSAQTGEILWRTSTISEPAEISGHTDSGTPIWGPSGASVWNTPTVSTKLDLLFVGSGNNHSYPASPMSDSVIAMELATGQVRWHYQAQTDDAWNAACLWRSTDRSGCPAPEGPDTDFGGTTMLIELEGREVVVAGQKSGHLHVLDAATGQRIWKKRIARGGPEDGIRYGMATRGDVLFVPSTDSRRNPEIEGDARPGLFAISAADGEVRWSSLLAAACSERSPCEEAVAAPPLAMSEVLFAGRVDGILHALDPDTGEILWEFDTTQEFTTLMGTSTTGGGIDGTVGPMFANGRLFVSSGYGQAARPGNALIVLAPE